MDDEQQTLARALGASIRAARQNAQLTMSQLATKTDLSQPFLSQTENGNVMPSVINLHRIAQALGTTAHQLLERGSRVPPRLTRAGESRSYPLSPDAVVRFCVEGTRLMDCNEVIAQPNSAAEAATTHEGEEIVYVMSGHVRMAIEGGTYDLHAGDTLYYAATSPHQWFNPGDEVAKFLFVGTPPGF